MRTTTPAAQDLRLSFCHTAPASDDDLALPLDLSVVIPTYDEAENVAEMIARLSAALEGLRWEATFVDDDSPDGTAEIVRQYARLDRRIRLVHRVGRRGLSSACMEGALASAADWVVVMDGDGQHDETVLRRMLERARDESLDLVVGTRHADNGSMGGFARHRVLISRAGEWASRAICKCDLSDPMSGFFLARRSFLLDRAHLVQTGGFKILVDLVASSPTPVRFAEVGYNFRQRQHGESKLDVNTAIEYATLLLKKLTREVVPTRFAIFCMVGAVGCLTYLGTCALFLRLHESFFRSEILATYIAMTGNFCLNNAITYRDRTLRGRRFFFGLLSFWLACSFGAWASVVFARAVLQTGVRWYEAGLMGVVLSSVWNYGMSSFFTWQSPRPQPMEQTSPDLASASLAVSGD